jgi:hypothetical protein
MSAASDRRAGQRALAQALGVRARKLPGWVVALFDGVQRQSPGEWGVEYHKADAEALAQGGYATLAGNPEYVAGTRKPRYRVTLTSKAYAAGRAAGIIP